MKIHPAKKKAVSATITSGAYDTLVAKKRIKIDDNGNITKISLSKPPIHPGCSVFKSIKKIFTCANGQLVKNGESLLLAQQRPTATSGVNIPCRKNNELTTTTTKKCNAANNSQAYKVNTLITSRSLQNLGSSKQSKVSLSDQISNLSVKKATADDISVNIEKIGAHNSQLKRDSVSDQSKCTHSVLAESIYKTKNNLINIAVENRKTVNVLLNTVSGSEVRINIKIYNFINTLNSISMCP